MLNAMKAKSLAAKNPYLQSPSADEWFARNVASSTSVETGKPSSLYVSRFRSTHPGRPFPASPEESPKKGAS